MRVLGGSRKSKVVTVVVLIGLAVSAVVVLGRFPDRITQPIKFNHQKHVEGMGLGCGDCHLYFKTEAFSGIPNIEVCQDCHSEDVSESPEAKKVKGYVERKEQIPWVQMYDVRPHVRFSHRLHIAKNVDCGECHGETGKSSSPTRYRDFSQYEKTMRFCIGCHETRGASTDCNTCHK